jgi:hypothetical protein
MRRIASVPAAAHAAAHVRHGMRHGIDPAFARPRPNIEVIVVADSTREATADCTRMVALRRGPGAHGAAVWPAP